MTNTAEKLSQIRIEAEKFLGNTLSLEDLQALAQKFLGKSSEISLLSKGMKTLSPEEKKEVGKVLSETRSFLQEEFQKKKQRLEKEALNAQLEKEWIDVTKSLPADQKGRHPLSIIQRKIEEVFSSMGFMIADGPHVETEWHNFDALNIPGFHPARDMQDTFWVKKDAEKSQENFVLRTQTSNVQIRSLKKYGAPIRVIAPGRVFRNEDIDATHDAVFYQVEGLLVDKDISLAHLKGTITTMLSAIFETEAKIRLRPGYFPFVEPGFEVDMWWEYTDKNGEKQGKWLEFMGAGMVHPNVLKNCGVDPEEYTGFAFGFGLTRLAMMKYGIDDIRFLLGQKMDFLRQF